MTAQRRDLGIDVVRVVALIEMVSIHYFQRLPSPSALTDVLNFVGEGAAATFFFAYGLTSHRFGSKTSGEQLTANLMFLFVGLAHNLFLWLRATTVDFLCFLFLWRIILSATTSLKRPHFAWLGLAFAVMALSLAIPQKGVVDRSFMQVLDGLFPLLPWGVFVLLGASYTAFRPAKHWAIALACAGVAVPLLLYVLEPSRASLGISKWPLTTPYVLLFTGANILLLEGVRSTDSWLRRWPLLVVPIEWLSTNLLLAAVLQYLPLELLYWAGRHIALLRPAPGDSMAVLLTIVIGSSACLLILVATLWLLTRIWDRVADSSALRSLRGHRHLVAVTLLVAIALLSTGPGRNLLGSQLLPTPSKPLAVMAMIYFAFELHHWQRRRREGRAAE
jgi:hypothetical protein